jgi:hypothetical protein
MLRTYLVCREKQEKARERETRKSHVGETHSVLITAILLHQRLSCYWGKIVSLRMLTNLRLADLRKTTAQQRSTGQNLPSDLHVQKIFFLKNCVNTSWSKHILFNRVNITMSLRKENKKTNFHWAASRIDWSIASKNVALCPSLSRTVLIFCHLETFYQLFCRLHSPLLLGLDPGPKTL